MTQQIVAAAEEKENSLAERQYLLAETVQQQKKCELLTQQEIELRTQLSLYSDKFEEFQQTLTHSNQVFSTFKKDTDKVGVASLGGWGHVTCYCRWLRTSCPWRRRRGCGRPGTIRSASH